jgi:hypothetical protein
MHAGNHRDVLVEDAIIQAVRKFRQEDAARVAMKDGVGLRVILDCCHGNIEGAAECTAQPWTLRLVPFERLSHAASASGVKSAGFTAT